MDTRRRRPLPPGRQPYDALTGLRIGAVAGALIGAVAALILGSAWWLMVLIGAVGGLLGYRYERGQIERDRSGPGQDGR